MEETRRRQYLASMGIDNWVARDSKAPVADAATESVDQERPPEARTNPSSPAGPAPAVAVEAPDNELPPWLDEVPPPLDEWLPEVDAEHQAATLVDDVSGLSWDALAYRVAHCQACALQQSRKNTVFGVGAQNADLMVIGEAPGAEEDRQGEPFVGRAGQLLNAMLLAIGFQRKQVYIANILKCRPPDNRDPRPEEVIKCEPFLRRQVALVRPKVILAVGRVAAQNLLKSEEAVGRMRGKVHRFDDIPLVVSYHPAYLLRAPDQKAKAWQDLQRAWALLRE